MAFYYKASAPNEIVAISANGIMISCGDGSVDNVERGFETFVFTMSNTVSYTTASISRSFDRNTVHVSILNNNMNSTYVDYSTGETLSLSDLRHIKLTEEQYNEFMTYLTDGANLTYGGKSRFISANELSVEDALLLYAYFTLDTSDRNSNFKDAIVNKNMTIEEAFNSSLINEVAPFVNNNEFDINANTDGETNNVYLIAVFAKDIGNHKHQFVKVSTNIMKLSYSGTSSNVTNFTIEQIRLSK